MHHKNNCSGLRVVFGVWQGWGWERGWASWNKKNQLFAFFASGLSLNIKVFRQFWLKVDHHWQRKHQKEKQHTKPHSITEHSNWVKALLSVAETLLQCWHIHASPTGFARRLIVQGKQLGNGLKLCPSISLSVVSHVEYSLSLARSVLFNLR